MTQNNLFACEETAADVTAGKLYLGMEHGKPAYAVIDSQGRMKFHWKCPYCNRDMHLFAPWRQAPGCQPTPATTPQEHHIETCGHAREAVEKLIAHCWDEQTGTIRHGLVGYQHCRDLNHLRQTLQYGAIHKAEPKPFVWRKRPGGGHKCNAACMGAKGPDCECACGGANHGCWHS